MGLVKEIDGSQVHRRGWALGDAPLALEAGTGFFEEIVQVIAPGQACLAFLEALQDVREHIPALGEVLRELDEGLWPAVAPINNVVLLALLPDGRREWLIHDNAMSRVILAADPHQCSRVALRKAEEHLDAVEMERPERDDWFTCALLGAVATPRAGAEWRPDEVILPLDWTSGSPTLPFDQ